MLEYVGNRMMLLAKRRLDVDMLTTVIDVVDPTLASRR